MNRIIEQKSPSAKIAEKIVTSRSHSFAVKVTMLFQMGLVDETLYENIRALNNLRNEYAHEIDVDFAEHYHKGFRKSDGTRIFPNPKAVRNQVQIPESDAAKAALAAIRACTFSKLNEKCAELNVDLSKVPTKRRRRHL